MDRVLFICTGNAARSVMAGAALEAKLPEVVVETAGTLAIDGLPMSIRTRAAMEGVGLAIPQHRSKQVSIGDLDRAALVVALAPEHVRWVRLEHPPAATRTATLKRLCRDLPDTAAPLSERVAALRLADVGLEDWEEVVDPGGGDHDIFAACAREVVELVDRLAALLHRPTPSGAT